MRFKNKTDWFYFARQGVLNVSPIYNWGEFNKLVRTNHNSFADRRYGCRWLQWGRTWFCETGAGMVARLKKIMSGRDKEIPRCKEYDFLIDSAVDPQGVLFNGEICEFSSGIYCFGSPQANVPMRVALKESGAEVRPQSLRVYLGDPDYEKLIGIVETFSVDVPQTVEFSYYSRGVGSYSEHLIIWEIREY